MNADEDEDQFMMNSVPIQELIKLTGLNQKGRKKKEGGGGGVRGVKREAKPKGNACTQSLATTTPLVRQVFEACFSGQIDEAEKGSSAGTTTWDNLQNILFQSSKSKSQHKTRISWGVCLFSPQRQQIT